MGWYEHGRSNAFLTLLPSFVHLCHTSSPVVTNTFSPTPFSFLLPRKTHNAFFRFLLNETMFPTQSSHVSSDEVAQLWTHAPRFIEIMRNGNGFQHPQYFFTQTDKLTLLLDRACTDIAVFRSCEEYAEAWQILSQLHEQSRFFGSLTREHLKSLESDVRAFVDRIRAVDGFVVEWDERKRNAMVAVAVPSKKRGRSVDLDHNEIAFVAPKKRRDTCGEQAMDTEAGFCDPFPQLSPWMQSAATQPVMWSEVVYD